MASSDDEGEAVPHTVSNYYFVDENNDPVSFLELPLKWNVGEDLVQETKQIFLHGTADNGLQKIYKQVLAWKFDIADLRPEMFVLSKENQWMQLLKPRKSYEEIIRSILITVHFLHFARKKSETSGKSLWDHLSKDFSSYETRPSEEDLIKDLVSEAITRDETLAKSELVVAFLEGKLQKKKAMDEEIGTMPNASFIVNDDMMDEFGGDNESDDEEDLFDTVCSICDNGGDILCCDGRCMRSFHATEESGEDSYCESLGWTERQVEAVQSFICRNCQYKQHQCFACGELGSSDKLSGAEVFPCVNATCGRFYHLPCVAKLLHRDDPVAAEELQKKVPAGGSFTCPIHKCFRCKKGEDKKDHDLQFAVCRRCPKAYHRKCLPREIAFEEDEDEGIPQRAWEGLIPNRILIYCLKHKIDDELKTPIRDHIKFPGDEPKKKKEPQQLSSREKSIPKKKNSVFEDESRKNLVKVRKEVNMVTSVRKANISEKSAKRMTGQDSVKKLERQDTTKEKPGSPVLGNRLYDYYANKSFKGLAGKECSEKVIEKPAALDRSSSVQLDKESKQRILALMEEATSSVTLEDILEKHNLPKTHVHSMKYVVDKTITLGKVEGSVEAIRAALMKLEEGGTIEDARAVCEPGLLHQITRWKNKMKVYLAPFLHGMRYTSFGRHFTKVDKLKEIVNVLHSYVQDGDMIVDFCCGANDFSWLMKTKLEQTGKKCSFKNYDILQAKNDFNFEKRDWMSVQKNELPEGSRLIMGLNPPFGVNASLANKFIDKALEFKPKLMILIVPKETERLDRKKKMPYDLIWEDSELLAGKSFYLPGSVDVYDNQLEDWNLSAPPLYLWSRPDWKAKHMSIAQQHGHLSKLRESPHLKNEENEYKSLPSDITMENRKPTDLDHPVKTEEQVLITETLPIKPENDDVNKLDEGQTHQRDEAGEDSKKRKLDKEKQENKPVKKTNKGGERETGVKASGQTPGKKKKRGGKKSHKRHHPPPKKTGNQPARHHDSRSEREDSRERDRYLGQNRSRSGSRPLPGYETRPPHMEESEMRPSNQWAGPASNYGERNLEDHFAGYRRESLDSHGPRQPYVGVEEQYARSAPIPQAGLYERQDPLGLSQRSNYTGSGQDQAYLSSYNRVGSTVDPRVGSSTMQRYAPRLDEMNHMRVNNNPGYDQFGSSRPGYTSSLAPQPDYRGDSLGFASGPRSYAPHNSSGWLNE